MNRIIQNPSFRFVLLFILMCSTKAYPQENTEIYIGINGRICLPEHASFTHKTVIKSSKVTVVQTLKKNDLKWDLIYTDSYHAINDSVFRIKTDNQDFTETIYRTYQKLDENNYQFKDVLKKKVVRSGTAEAVVPLILNGTVTEYYKNGAKKSVSEYSHNELLSNDNWNEDGTKYISDIYYSFNVDPTFKPGMKALHQHILKGFHDAGADLQAISGSILIGFVVMEDGEVDGIRIVKGIAPHLNSIALNQFSTLLGEWTPARLNNRTVRAYQVFPINFIFRQYQFEFAEIRGAILHFGAY
jgi:hypothetical protein